MQRGSGRNAARSAPIVAVGVLIALVLAVAIAVVAIALLGDSGGRDEVDAARRARPAVVSTPATAPITTVPAPATTDPPLPATTDRPGPVSTPPVTAPSGEISVLRIEDARPEGYVRELFGSGWTDADRDCQDTRAEALVQESRVPVVFTGPEACTVASGEWLDPWSGTVTTSARALDVDHTVPLANAWRSGAWAWSPQQRVAYANDLADAGHLIAIPLGENRSKGDDGPEAWRPPLRDAWCAYAQLWTSIKARWDLSATAAEWAALQEMVATC